MNMHFEDRIEDGRMVFDYRIRPGVVEHSNALALMRAVGFDVVFAEPDRSSGIDVLEQLGQRDLKDDRSYVAALDEKTKRPTPAAFAAALKATA